MSQKIKLFLKKYWLGLSILALIIILSGMVVYWKSKETKRISLNEVSNSAVIATSSDSSELNLLKREIEDLRKQQIVQNNQTSPKILTTSEIIEKNKFYIVRILCETSEGWVSGSGISLGKDSTGRKVVLTNYHVVNNTISKQYSPCIVGYNDGVFYYGEPSFYSAKAPEKTYEQIDFAFLELKGLIEGTTTAIDENGSIINQEKNYGFSSLSQMNNHIALINSHPPICEEDDLKIGESLVILGYPVIGAEQGFWGPIIKLTATEGIISDQPTGIYFSSSAKIDQGNSGGGAFFKSSGCLAGMPTFVNIGVAESLGKLINIPKLFNSYLVGIFSY